MDKYLDFRNKVNYEQLKVTGQVINKGGLVIFPTETVYGIGTNGLDENAIKKLYSVKQRNLNKPINLLVSSIDMVKDIAEDITPLEYKLMETFFPGPFTIILKKKKNVPNILTANKDTVGVRMPNCKIAQKLIEYANCPIAAPSANISDKPSTADVNNIIDDFYDEVNYIIDGGKSDIGIASTIAQVIDGNIKIWREGSITKDQINSCL